MNGQELFKNMKGFEYFIDQLDYETAEERQAHAYDLLYHIVNGFHV